MNKVLGFFQSRKVWMRPFDFYVALLLFCAGLYSIVNDKWPEGVGNDITETFIVIVSLYLMTAAAVIMVSLLCKKASRPVFSLMGELYGWMFVAAASLATSIMYIGAVLHNEPSSWWLWGILFTMWVGMTIASSIRSFDLIIVYRSLQK
jgi:hypothetical protein